LVDAAPSLLENLPIAKRTEFSTIVENAKLEMEEAKKLVQASYLHSVDIIGESDDNGVLGGKRATQTLSYAANEIDFYVSRLMDLQPAMEGLLNFLIGSEDIIKEAHGTTACVDPPSAQENERNNIGLEDCEMTDDWNNTGNDAKNLVKPTEAVSVERPGEDNMPDKMEGLATAPM
jgi:hypothetical protein